jgi:hypothetical protein
MTVNKKFGRTWEEVGTGYVKELCWHILWRTGGNHGHHKYEVGVILKPQDLVPLKGIFSLPSKLMIQIDIMTMTRKMMVCLWCSLLLQQMVIIFTTSHMSNTLQSTPLELPICTITLLQLQCSGQTKKTFQQGCRHFTAYPRFYCSTPNTSYEQKSVTPS